MSINKDPSKLRNFLIAPSVKGKLPTFFYLQLCIVHPYGNKYYQNCFYCNSFSSYAKTAAMLKYGFCKKSL